MFQSTRFKANSFSVQCSGDVFTTSEFTNSCVPSIYKEKFSSPILCFEKKRSDVARSSPGFYRHNLPSIMIRNLPSLKVLPLFPPTNHNSGPKCVTGLGLKSVDWLGCHLPIPVATQCSKSRQWLSSILRRWRHSEAALASSIPIKAFSHKK